MLETLFKQESLTQEQSQAFFTQVVQGDVDPILLSAVLTALKIKGESPAEIAGAAAALRASATPFEKPPGLYADSCGTGGDGANTINVSTTAAIVAASCGLPMVKHGNRSVSSRSGSADLLESFGIKLDMTPEVARRTLDAAKVTFLFAPAYHPGIKHAMPVRNTLKTRTLFNLLGPLVNPSAPGLQLLGVYSPELCLPMAQTLQRLGCEKAMVVHGSGTDEIALHGETQVVEIQGDELREYRITPADFGVTQAPLSALEGGDPKDNADAALAIFKGQGKTAHMDAVALNVGALLFQANIADSFAQGADMAKQAMLEQKPLDTLHQFVEASNG